MKNKNKIRYLGKLALLIIAVLAIWGCLVYNRNQTSPTEIKGPFHVKDNKGTDEQFEGYTDYSYGKMKCGDWIEFSFTMPEDIRKDNSLCIEANYVMFDVSVDGKCIYSNADSLKKARYLGQRFYVPIQADMHGKDVTIKYTAADTTKQYEIPRVYIGEIYNNYSNFINNHMGVSAMAALFLFVGVIVLIFELILHDFQSDNLKLLFLSILAITSSAWIFLLTDIADVIIDAKEVLYYSEYILSYLTVISAVLFLLQLDEYRKKYKKILEVYILVIIVLGIISGVCDITGIATFHKMVKFYHFALVIGMLLMCIRYFTDNRKDKSKKNVVFGYVFVIILMMVVFQIVRFYVSDRGSFSSDNTLPYIVIIMVMLFVYKYASDLVESREDKAQILILEKLAYVDALTGIANRNKCEKTFQDINEVSVGLFKLIMFDINGLKYVNDTFGHSYGDELIQGFAKALKNVFTKEGIFVGRMGGDEFVVILNEENIPNEEMLLDNLCKYVKYVNSTNVHKYDIKYSYGTSLCDRTRNNDIWKKYSKADSNMYAMKHK